MRHFSHASACPSGRSFPGLAFPGLLLLATTLAAQDTVVVHADGPPAWGPNVRLVAAFALGAVDGPPEYAFGLIGSTAVDGSGGFYVYDYRDVQIRHYDVNGRFTGVIGRKGQGPGEYGDVSGIDVAEDSLLIVCDPSTRRMTIFGPDGKVRRMVSPPAHIRGSPPDCIAGREGIVFRRTRLVQPRPGLKVPMIGPVMQYMLSRLDGTFVDSMYLGPRLSEWQWVLSTSDGMRHAFPAETLGAAWTGGGVLRAWSMAYRIAISTPDGHVVLIERKAPRVALTGPERAEWVAWDTYIHETHPGELPTSIPHEKPYFRDLMSDHLGRIWVQLYAKAEKRNMAPRPAGDPRPLLTWKERNTHDVFAPEGRYLGRVELPAESQLLAVRDDRVFLRLTGTQGEERIGVFRIRGARTR